MSLSDEWLLQQWADNDDYIVSLRSNDGYKSDSWTHDNQLYMSFLSQVDDLLNSLTQSIQPCTIVAIVIEDSIGSSRGTYICIASSQNRFILPDLFIAMNLSKCERTLCSLYRSKKAPYDSFYKDK